MPDDDLDTPEPPEQESRDIRRLRELAKRGEDADTARAEADAAKRELVFVKAGLNPDDPKQGYFVRGYAGDVTVDAVKAAATDAGFLGGEPATSAPEGMSEAERAAFAGTSSAAAGGFVEPPEEDIYDEFRGKTFRSGETAENYGARLAAKIAQHGGEVSFDGPFKEYPGDTGIIPKPGTPVPRRLS